MITDEGLSKNPVAALRLMIRNALHNNYYMHYITTTVRLNEGIG